MENLRFKFVIISLLLCIRETLLFNVFNGHVVPKNNCKKFLPCHDQIEVRNSKLKEKSDLFFHNVIDIEGNKPADQKPSREINLVANLLMNNKN